jgi:small subunit ribosomal protein S6
LTEDDFTRVLGKVNDQITKLGGTVTETNQWGKRRLAYPIKKQAEGTYVLEKVQINQTALKELDANLKMSEDILRYLFVRENS